MQSWQLAVSHVVAQVGFQMSLSSQASHASVLHSGLQAGGTSHTPSWQICSPAQVLTQAGAQMSLSSQLSQSPQAGVQPSGGTSHTPSWHCSSPVQSATQAPSTQLSQSPQPGSQSCGTASQTPSTHSSSALQEKTQSPSWQTRHREESQAGSQPSTTSAGMVTSGWPEAVSRAPPSSPEPESQAANRSTIVAIAKSVRLRIVPPCYGSLGSGKGLSGMFESCQSGSASPSLTHRECPLDWNGWRGTQMISVAHRSRARRGAIVALAAALTLALGGPLHLMLVEHGPQLTPVAHASAPNHDSERKPRPRSRQGRGEERGLLPLRASAQGPRLGDRHARPARRA